MSSSSSKKFFVAIISIVVAAALLVVFALRDKTIAMDFGSSLLSASEEEQIKIFDLDSIEWGLEVVEELEI